MSTNVQLTFLACMTWGVILFILRSYMRPVLSTYARAFLGMIVAIALISVFFKGGMLAFFYEDMVALTGRDRFFRNVEPEKKWMYGMVVGTLLLTCLTFGIMIWDRLGLTPDLERWKPGFYTVGDHKTDTMTILISTFVSLLAVLFLAWSIGFDVLIEDISGKRKPLENIGIYVGIKVAFFARIAALFALMHVFLGRSTASTKLCMLVLIFSIVISSAFVSNRSYLFGFFFEVYLLALICGKRMNMKIVLSIAVGMVGLLWVSISRMGDRLEGLENLEFFVLGRLLEGRYLFDITKLGGIGMWFLENDFAYRGGSLNWILYPFMDVWIWRDTGPFIAANVFGEDNQGVTQGMALEMIILYSGYNVVICYTAALATITFISLMFIYGSRALSAVMSNKLYPVLQAILFGKFLMMYNSAFGAAFFSMLVDLVYLVIFVSLAWASRILVSVVYSDRQHRPVPAE